MDKTQEGATSMGRFAHIVLYTVNPNNPEAAEMIIRNANTLLAPILDGDSVLHVARIPSSERAVGGNKFQVALTFIFGSRALYNAYMKHPKHLEFVRFVLNGWMIEGSQAEDPGSEFIHHILNAGPDAPPVKWARNPAIAEKDVVWHGEEVYDAYDS